MTSLVLIVLVLLTALIAPLITAALHLNPHKYYSDQIDENFGLPNHGLTFLGSKSGITWRHPLGVEPTTGRDLFSRLLYGARVSLLIGIAATTVFVPLIFRSACSSDMGSACKISSRMVRPAFSPSCACA